MKGFPDLVEAPGQCHLSGALRSSHHFILFQKECKPKGYVLNLFACPRVLTSRTGFHEWGWVK